MSKHAVKLLAQGLSIGEDTGFVECPFCMAAHEEKFSVTRTVTGLLYNCFRASCGASGFIPTGYWDDGPAARTTPKPKNRPYINALYLLTDMDTTFFKEEWGVDPIDFKVTSKDEYALPILHPVGFPRGWVIRQPVWKGVTSCPRKGVPNKPKALNYKDRHDHSRLSWSPWSRVVNPHQVVVVEDIISAWKIGQCYRDARGVALNGAKMGYPEAAEIAKENPTCVTIWLDPDVTNQAYKILHRWGLSFNYCRVVTSDADPKDMTPKQIEEILHVEW